VGKISLAAIGTIGARSWLLDQKIGLKWSENKSHLANHKQTIGGLIFFALYGFSNSTLGMAQMSFSTGPYGGIYNKKLGSN
jgi:hypothetical protein